jgi:hypothetical protein
MGLGALALLGCGDVGGNDDLQQVTGDVNSLTSPPATAATIAFQSFSDDVGKNAATASRTLIRNARGYQALFGHAPPASVDFSHEWVMFYAAGTKPTGGYQASFLAVLRAGRTLIAITRLESPGAGCATTDALTTPYALIKFPAQDGTAAQFYKQDGTSDCAPNLCAAVTCPTGSDCDPATGKCTPGPIRCGGIAGISCPGIGKCVDDPNDGCDPAKGGADCGGICSCVQNIACTTDTKFDGSPSVCACVPVKPPVCGPVCDIYCQYGNVLDAQGCPTCKCNPPPDDSCAAVLCPTGTRCEGGKCLAAGPSCGGIIGKPCPGFGKCVDDPSDSCDPTKGGADCGGICQCVQNVACDANSKFDGSPSVCACVPVGPVCPPVCKIFCEYGNVLDANGCATCACNPPPAGPSCGGIAGKPCPGFGKCVDDPSDSCDPAKGGADCGGICSCVQNVACTTNTRFDSSPSVCTCVPLPSNACPPEKCPTPGPKVATMKCDDGSTAGPVCALSADNVCGWTITHCPTAN